jgi:hypothetical protein
MAATVTSTFELIDRASGTIRSLRRELRDLEADARKAGLAMDEMGGPRTSRNLNTSAREMRTLGGDTQTAGRELDSTARSADNTARRLDSMAGKTKKASLELGVLGKLIGFLKWPLLIAGAGGAVQAIAALGGGVVALLPRLLDLSGATAAYGAVAVGAGAAMGVWKLATHDLTQALGGNKKALASLTPEARGFLQELKNFHPVLQSFRSAAQKGLFPGLSGLLGDLRSQAPQLKSIIGQTAGDLGGIGRFLGQQLSQPGFMHDLGQLADEGARALGSAARGGFYFAQALEQVLLAAGPFVDWLGTSVVHLAKMAEQEAFVARQTGQLGGFFDRTKQSIKLMWDIGKNVFGGLRGLLQGASATGDSLWMSIDRITKRFDDWANSLGGQLSIRRWFDEMRPVLRETVGLIGDLAKGLGSLASGTQGAQMLQALRAAIPSLVGALKSLVTGFGPAAFDALGGVVRLFGDLTGYSGPLTLVARSIGTLASAADTLVKALGPLGPALATTLGTLGLLRKMGAFGSAEKMGWVDALRLKWLGVRGAALGAAGAERTAVELGSMPAGVPVPGRGGIPGVPSGGGSVILPPGVQGPTAAAGGISTAEAALAGGGSAAAVNYLRSRGVLGAGETMTASGVVLPAGVTAAEEATPGLLARAGGLLSGVGSKALSAVGKFAPILLAFQGVLGALSTQGGVGNKALGGLNAATFGLGGKALSVLTGGIIPSAPDLTPAQKRQAGALYGQNIVQHLGTGGSLAAQRRAVSTLRGAIQTLPGNDAFDQTQKNLHAATAVLQKELKRREGLLAQSTAAVNRQLDATSIKNAQVLAGQFVGAFDILKGPKGPQAAMKETVGNILDRMRTMRPAGARVLGDSMLEWVRTQARNNPKLWAQYKLLKDGILSDFSDLHKHIVLVNGQILTGSTTEWQQIAAALITPTEKAREEVSKNFTAIQQQAVGSLTAMGYTPAQAAQLIQAVEQGKSLPSSTLLRGGGSVSSAVSGAASTVAGSTTGHHKASGGRMGGFRIPGTGTLDTIPMADGGLAAPGELVVNRHTERDVDRDLMMAGRPSLDMRVRRETRKHYMPPGRTTGGRTAPVVTGGPAGPSYIYPFPGNTSIGRTDQGIDVTMPVGSPIGPMGDARVMGVIPDWYQGQPYIWWRLLSGPRAGQYGYAAEQITNLAPIGSRVAANQAVATYAGSGTAVEYGWATASGETLAKATTGYSEGQVTPAGSDMRAFLAGLAHGKIIGGGVGGVGASRPQQIGPLKAPGTRLKGVPGDLVIAGGRIYAAGLRQQINKALGAAGGGGVAGGAVGPLVTASDFTAGPQTASGHTYVPGFAELSNPPSSLNFSALGGLPMGRIIDVNYQGRTISIPKIDVGAGGGALAPATVRAIDLSLEAAGQLGFSGLGNVTWRDTGRQAFDRGGRMAAWGGWHGKGVDMTVNRPTVFGAGENGPERVRVTPAGRGGSVRVNATATINAGHGISERRVRQLWDKYAEKFAEEVAAEIENGAEIPTEGALH